MCVLYLGGLGGSGPTTCSRWQHGLGKLLQFPQQIGSTALDVPFEFGDAVVNVAGGVEVPGNDAPLFRTPAIIEQEMVLVKTIPVLNQDRGRKVIDVFV